TTSFETQTTLSQIRATQVQSHPLSYSPLGLIWASFVMACASTPTEAIPRNSDLKKKNNDVPYIDLEIENNHNFKSAILNQSPPPPPYNYNHTTCVKAAVAMAPEPVSLGDQLIAESEAQRLRSADDCDYYRVVVKIVVGIVVFMGVLYCLGRMYTEFVAKG
ncbi:hypothetical protein BKA61DRAFT_698232, partial [Leptodontidium sp. MPI-SDFR-AT-0119]